MGPSLSVIIPAYNVAAYICDAVESALAQSYSDLEVIVVDDGSTDGTMEALHDIEDDRLHRLRQKHLGIAAALNYGIRAAKGGYIGFLDGDDLWPRRKAERHISFMSSHPEKDVTFSYALLINASGMLISPIKSHGAGDLSFRNLLIGCPNGSAIVRREALEQAGPFDTDLVRNEDLDMWLRIALQREANMYCLPEYLALYRRRPGQLTADIEAMEVGWQQVIRKFRILAPAEVRKSEADANQAMHVYYASLAYETKRYAEAFSFLRTSMGCSGWKSLCRYQTWMLAGLLLFASVLPESLCEHVRRGLHQWRCRVGGWDGNTMQVGACRKGHGV